MILEPPILVTLIALTAILSRLPFLRFPMDDDFAIYTYIARFACKGFQWKKDLFLIGNPIWRMRLLDTIYGKNPEQGVLRLRLFFMVMHVITSLILYYGVWSLTQNLWAAFACGLLYSFYGSSPDFTAGNYSFELFYIPCIFIGLTLLPKESVAYAGFFFGLAAVAKWGAGIYAGVLTGVVAYQYGFLSALAFAGFAALPAAISILADWQSGYIDAVGKKQCLTRLATTLRLIRTKRMYFSVPREILRIMGQTLPVWIIGVPAFFIAFSGKYGIWLMPFTAVLVAMIILQRGFSRYHYHPLIALLSFATGLGIDHLLNQNDALTIIAFGALALTVAGNLVYMLPLYTQPLDTGSLAQHEKFDQYIYLPYLGKLLQRLIRMRGETKQRIFVWGTFSQLYHITGLPAADTFLHHTIGPWDTPDLEPYFDSLIGGLIRHKPIYLIKTFHDLDVAQLEQVTGLKYQLIKVVLVRFPVYRLISAQTPAVPPLSLPWQEKMRILQSLTEKEKANDPGYIKKTDCEWKHTPGINKTDLKSGRLRTALKECRKLCKLNPYDIQGLYLLGKLYDWSNLPDESADAFNRLLRLAPNHPHARLILAKQNITKGNLEEAEMLIHDDIRLFGSREETDFYFGQICQKRKQYGQAASYFEKITKTIPEWVDVKLHLADSLMELGQIEAAGKTYDQAFDSVGNHPDGAWYRAQAAMGAAKASTARHLYSETPERYLQRDPQNIILAYAKAEALELEGKISESRSLFEKFAESFKDYIEIDQKGYWENTCFHLGKIYQKSGQHKQAMLCFEKVIRSVPQWIDVRFHLADSLMALGQTEAAGKTYDQAFNWAGNHSDGARYRAEAAKGVARAFAARCPQSETLERYFLRDPKNIILAYAKAEALEQEGKISESRSLFEKFAESFKDYIEIDQKDPWESMCYHLGKIHQKSGQHKQAIRCFEKILQSVPRWVEASMYLAESLIELDQSRKALEIYTQAFDQIGNHFDGDWLRAQAALGAAKILAPEHPRSETLESFSNRDPQNDILAYARTSALEQEGKTQEARSLFEKHASSFKKDHLRANALFRLARLSSGDRQEHYLNECLRLVPTHTGALKLLQEHENKIEPA